MIVQSPELCLPLSSWPPPAARAAFAVSPAAAPLPLIMGAGTGCTLTSWLHAAAAHMLPMLLPLLLPCLWGPPLPLLLLLSLSPRLPPRLLASARRRCVQHCAERRLHPVVVAPACARKKEMWDERVVRRRAAPGVRAGIGACLVQRGRACTQQERASAARKTQEPRCAAALVKVPAPATPKDLLPCAGVLPHPRRGRPRSPGAPRHRG